MNSPNGEPIIRIGRKGKKKIQIGDGPVIEVDIVATHNAWTAIDKSYRDEKGEVPADKIFAMNQHAFQFVLETQVGLAGFKDEKTQKLLAADIASKFSMAEALEFLRILTEEALALRSFFEVRSPNAPSLPESTELRFST